LAGDRTPAPSTEGAGPGTRCALGGYRASRWEMAVRAAVPFRFPCKDPCGRGCLPVWRRSRALKTRPSCPLPGRSHAPPRSRAPGYRRVTIVPPDPLPRHLGRMIGRGSVGGLPEESASSSPAIRQCRSASDTGKRAARFVCHTPCFCFRGGFAQLHMSGSRPGFDRDLPRL